MNKTFSSLPTINPDELSRRAVEIYSEIKNGLEKTNVGDYVAIEVDSGSYFVGSSQIEAWEKAKKKFPGKIFYFIKIGFPAVSTHSVYQTPVSYGSIF